VTTQRRVAVVSAGLTQPSSTRLLADRLALVVERSLQAAGDEVAIESIDLREHAQDLVNHLLTGFPSPSLQAAVDAVVGADGVVAVTPVYNASYSGLFKLFFDVLERGSLTGVPILVGATGGTPRHSLVLDHAMRPLFAYLGAPVVPTGVYAATADWGESKATVEAPLASRIERAGRELADAISGRAPRRTTDAFADPVPFDELLRGS
jgi:FMN reductase